jgi:phosphodiesterase/alkaline phosphatase D-like protein
MLKTALVGSNSGGYVYVNNGGNWVLQGSELTVAGSSGLGSAVSLSADGNTALLGAPGSGSAWAFVRNGTVWSQFGTGFTLPGAINTNNGGGAAVALSADGYTAVLGAPSNGNEYAEGGTWIYTRSGNNFVNQGGLILGSGNNTSADGAEGTSVALSATGSTAIIGAPQNYVDQGLAFVLAAIVPSVTTTPATNVTSTTASINGHITTAANSGTVDFEWGTDPNLVGATTTTTFSQGTNPVAPNTYNEGFVSSLTGLTPATIYYFRIDGTNLNGTANGTILSFETEAAGPPTSNINFSLPSPVTYGSTIVPVISSTDPNGPIHYNSTNTNIVTVNSSDQLIATGLGQVIIVAVQDAAGTTYEEGHSSADVTVIQAPLTLTADNKTVPFGQPIPAFTATANGFVNGDSQNSFATPLRFYSNVAQNSAAGTYGINIEGGPYDPNYNITYNSGTLTITPVYTVPAATTVTQTNVTATGATLNGTANGNGDAAYVTIQYTTNDGDGLEDLQTATLTTGPDSLPGNAGTTNYSAVLTGLTPNTTYYYIITSSNPEFTTQGNVMSFTTPAATAPPTITAISPSSGPIGTLVTITGTNLGSPTAFTIGGKTAIAITNTGTQLVGFVMPGSVTGAVSVTTAGGSATSGTSFTVTPTPFPLVQEGNPMIQPSTNQDHQGQAVAVSSDGLTALVSEPYVNSAAGAVLVYIFSGGSWAQQAKLSATNLYAYQGTSVALSADGNTAMISGPTDSTGRGYGAVWFYTRTGTTWTLQAGPVNGTGYIGMYIQQGSSCAISADGNTAVEGSYNDNGGIGAIWVFTRSADIWTQQGPKLTPSDNSGQANMGKAVTISSDGNTILAGGPQDGSNYLGATWVFVRTGNIWAQQGSKLVGPSNGNFERQGSALSLSADGNIALIGGPGNNQAFVFTRSGSTWAMLGAAFTGTGITGSAGNNSNAFGTAVGLSADGNTAFIGGEFNGDFDSPVPGGNWSFTRKGNAYIQQAGPFLGTGAGTTQYGGQGASVALSSTGATGITGGPQNGTNYQGGAWAFMPGALTAAVITFAPPAAVTYGAADVTPAATSTNTATPITYTSSNTAVATIVNGKIHIIAAGSTNITASQPAGGSYSAARPVTQPFTVNPAPLTITASNQSRAYRQPNPALTVTYATFVNGDTPASLTTQPTVSTTATIASVAGTYPITASAAADPNYTITYAAGTLTVTATAPVAVTKPATSVNSGGATLNGTVNDNGANTTVGMQYGTAPDLSSATTVTTTTGANPLPGGSGTTAFTSVLTGLDQTTVYYFRIVSENSAGTTYGNILSFNTPVAPPQTETITFNPLQAVTYGSADAAPGATSTNATIPITYSSSNTAIATIVNGKIHIIAAGITNITASQAGNASYSAATPVTQTFTVKPATLVITATNQVWPYAGTEPALTVTYNAFVNGDTQASLTTQPTVSTTATASSPLGSYPITATGAVDPNYTISYVPGTLQVTAGVPTAVTEAATQVAITGATLNGLVNADGAGTTVNITYSTAPDLSASPVIITIGTNITSTVNATYSTAVSSLAPNTTYYFRVSAVYSTGTVNGNILSFTTLSQSGEAITFNPLVPVTYGSPDVTPGATSTNTTIPITYASSNTAVATIVNGKIHIVAAGTTQITASQAGNATYSAATPVSQSFTVLQAPLTVTANNQTKVYGAENPGLTLTYNGFVYSDNSSSFTSQPTVTTTATTGSAVGSYPITVNGAADANYSITFVNGALTVTPAALTITANNETKTQGAPNPDLTLTYTGFVNEDNSSSLTTQPTVSTAATIASAPGTYPITVLGAVDANYNITYVNGTLTVNPQLAFGPIPAKTYGNPDFNPGAVGVGVTYTSSKTAVATIVNGLAHITGAGTSVITASIGDASLQQTLLVNPAPLTITANNQTSVYGAAIPDLTVSYAGFVYEEDAGSLTTPPSVSTTATSGSGAGTYPISVSGAVDGNYTITYVAGTLTIGKAPQTITFADIPNQIQYTTYDLSGVTASSGLPVTFTLSDSTVAGISGTTLTSLAPGNETVTATQPGNANYQPAAAVLQSFTVREPDNGEVVVEPVVSPNGDGINDVLKIINIENYPDNKMILINRNSVKIFEISGYDNKSKVFDGHSNITGVFQQQGTYLYLLEYRVNGHLKRKTGFTILRY